MVHIVGSNINLGRNAANDREWKERSDANFNWIKTIYSVARNNEFAAIVLTMQVNPGWNGVPVPVPVANIDEGSREAPFPMEDETIVFGKPVLTIMGDSRIFRIDKPILAAKSGWPLENPTRLEAPGVRVDPTRRRIFGFELEYLPENFAAHSRP